MFDCRVECCDPQARYIAAAQRDNRCTLPHYHGKWGAGPPPAIGWRLPLGAPPRWDLSGQPIAEVDRHLLNGNARHPSEDLEDGCPGGWFRCRYISTFEPYRRQRSASGLHDSNPLIHQGTDPRVLEALRYFEAEEAVAHQHVENVKHGAV